MQKIFNIIIMLTVLYLVLTQKEGMSNTDVKKIINDVYQADINSIRNLSKLANDLTTNGKLIVPGGLEVKGKITTDTLEVKNTSDFGTSSNRKISIIPANYKTDGTYFAFFNGTKRTNYMIPRTTGEFYNNGSFNSEGDVTGTNIIVRKDVKANGNGYFGPAYIGKYGKTRSDWAQFSHKDNR